MQVPQVLKMMFGIGVFVGGWYSVRSVVYSLPTTYLFDIDSILSADMHERIRQFFTAPASKQYVLEQWAQEGKKKFPCIKTIELERLADTVRVIVTAVLPCAIVNNEVVIDMRGTIQSMGDFNPNFLVSNAHFFSEGKLFVHDRVQDEVVKFLTHLDARVAATHDFIWHDDTEIFVKEKHTNAVFVVTTDAVLDRAWYEKSQRLYRAVSEQHKGTKNQAPQVIDMRFDKKIIGYSLKHVPQQVQALVQHVPHMQSKKTG